VVVQICQRLEGIPLAIELAAVRLRVLSVEQLLRRLDDRFGLLTSGPRTAQRRQQTLRATIDWSFGLCSPEERRAWTQLSVFPGGFDLDAAEHVCEPGDAQVLDVVTGLVDKSVLTRRDGTFGGHAWYRMLETVREYAEAKLAEEGGEHAVRARQVEHYVGLARRYRNDMFGPRQVEWLGRMWREHANFRAVLEYCLSTPDDASHALDIGSALWIFWYSGGLALEGYRYLRRGLDLSEERTMVRAQALYAATYLGIQIGETDSVRWMLAEHRTLAEEFDDEQLRAENAECSGIAAYFAGDLSGGAELLERALAGYHVAGDAVLVCSTLTQLAGVYLLLDDARGAAAAEELLGLADRNQAQWARAYGLWLVAMHRWRTGECAEAAALVREAISLRLGDRALLAFLLGALAWCACSDGDHGRAAGLLGAARGVWRLSGARVRDLRPYQGFDDECAAQARKALGDKAFDTAFAQAAGFGLDEAIRYALDEKPARASASSPERTGLTRRERQIAELVARGMSNKEIAAALVIGTRTVESHVENILAKLGFTSRTQVASWMAAQPRQSP
jgi:DNA-binding CsgD family transcriptional regulator